MPLARRLFSQSARASRSARDATRFTPNTPSFSGNAPSSSPASKAGNVRNASAAQPSTASDTSPNPFQSSAPPPNRPMVNTAPVRHPGSSGPHTGGGRETPQQKVARLRREHLERKAASLTSWDRIILRSRDIADAAHRWTIMGILTFSVLAGGLTIFAAVDMITYNRRKKREFYHRYQALWEERHTAAVAAEAAGTATATQLAITKQEREAQEYHARKESQTIWQRVKGVLGFAEMSEEAGGKDWEKQRKELLELEGGQASVAEGEPILDTVAVEGSQFSDAVEAKRRAGEKALERQGYTGGPLDQMADHAADAAQAVVPQSKGWFSWPGGK